MPKGLTYLGIHSFRDLGVTMSPNREIGIPNKKKYKQTIPFSNVVYDFSEIFGSQIYEERTLKYTFNIADRQIKTKDQMNWLKTKVINWLMDSHGKQPLYDDNYPGFYFLAEVEGSSSFREDWYYGLLEVEFKAYPFMISSHPEGYDVWDDFNFELDVTQELNFNLPESLYVYNQLSIGSNATIAAWATATLSGKPGNLVGDVGITRQITGMVETTASNSKRAYNVKDFDDPILEQDILQACTNYKDIVLVNGGTPSISPKITLKRTDGTGHVPKISIQKMSDDSVFHIIGEEPNNLLFMIDSGENRLRLYNQLGTTIDFLYHKEMI